MKVLLLISIIHHILNLLVMDHDTRFRAVSYMDLESGMLSLENFKAALSNIQRHPKLECIKGRRIYILLHWTSLSAFFSSHRFCPPKTCVSNSDAKQSNDLWFLSSSSSLFFFFFFLWKSMISSRLLHIGALHSGMHEEVGS